MARGLEIDSNVNLPEGMKKSQSPTITTSPDLTPEEAQLESQARQDTLANYPKLLAEYVRRSVRGGQVVINSDEAKPLIKGYGETPQERALASQAVHPSSAALAQGAFDYALNHWPDPTKSEVDFLTGMQGTGKTTLRESGALDHAGIVYERNMSDPDTARTLIQSAIDAGRKPAIDVLLPADPIHSLDAAIRRIDKGGHAVRIWSMADIYTGTAQTIPALKQEFGDDLTVRVRERMPNGAVKLYDPEEGIARLSEIAHTVSRGRFYEKLKEHLDQKLSAGEIEPWKYRAFLGRASGQTGLGTIKVLGTGTPGGGGSVPGGSAPN